MGFDTGSHPTRTRVGLSVTAALGLSLLLCVAPEASLAGSPRTASFEAKATTCGQSVIFAEAKRLPATRAFLDERFSQPKMDRTDCANPSPIEGLTYVPRAGADACRVTDQYNPVELEEVRPRARDLTTTDDTPFPLAGTREAAMPKRWEGAHVFDPTSAKPNDSVAGMTVASVHMTPGTGDFPGPVGRVAFSGQATISGTFRHIPHDDPFFGGEIAFFADAESLNRLPRLYYDERDVWFLFANAEEAKRAFGNPPEGAAGVATIVIDRYEIVYQPTEVSNTAVLVSVVNRSK